MKAGFSPDIDDRMRPGRKMPSARLIHHYWTAKDRLDFASFWFGQRDPDDPTCYACGWEPDDTWHGFDRAHIIDRAWGGLDGPQNLTLLCRRCHLTMPIFDPGEEEQALVWYATHPTADDWWKLRWDELSHFFALLQQADRPNLAGWPAFNLARMTSIQAGT